MLHIGAAAAIVYTPIMRSLTLVASTLLLLGASACSAAHSIEHEDELHDQGIRGEVRFWEGDFMPPFPSGTITPVSREIVVYPVITLDEVEREGGGFYPSLPGNPVATTVSDEDGLFEVGLPPGEYSFFVWEDGRYYANGFSSHGIYVVTVEEGEFTEITFDIDHSAAY